MKCSCPTAATIGTLTQGTCFERFGQVQAIIFQRIHSSAGVKNTFPVATSDPDTKASWTPFFTATDGTKMLILKDVAGFVIEPGAEKTAGSGNDVVGGIPISLGNDFAKGTFKLNDFKQAVIKQLKALKCETGNLGMYIINEWGQVGGLSQDSTATMTNFYPIPLATFNIGDKGFGGKEALDVNAGNFSLVADILDDFAVINPTDFDPRTDFINS